VVRGAGGAGGGGDHMARGSEVLEGGAVRQVGTRGVRAESLAPNVRTGVISTNQDRMPCARMAGGAGRLRGGVSGARLPINRS